jgi:uncharacterized protein (TIGR00369 family)
VIDVNLRAMPVPPPELMAHLKDFIPFNRFLGIELVAAEEGWVRLELPYRPEFLGDASRPALHGGVISTLIDTCGGFAVFTAIPFGEKCSTIDLRVDYLAPGGPDRLIAEGRVVRVGNRVGVVDVKCFQPSAPERIVATGKGVYNIKRLGD